MCCSEDPVADGMVHPRTANPPLGFLARNSRNGAYLEYGLPSQHEQIFERGYY